MALFTPIADLLGSAEPRAPAPLALPGLAFWVPPLCDVYAGNTAYVWFRVVQFTHDGDLTIERFSTRSLGEPPTWLEVYEDIEYELLGTVNLRGFVFALEHGIAPGTPFLVELGEPHTYRCSYEYEEYDTDMDIEVVRVLARDPLKAAKSFERATGIRQRVRAAQQDYALKLLELQRSDISAMFLERDLYFIGESWRDEMAVPTGHSIALCSSHTVLPGGPRKSFGRRDFCYGRDPDSWDEALENLFPVAEQVLGLTKEQVQQLPTRWRR